MSSFFDIRDRIPTYGKHAHGKDEPEELYDEINLMCYLLRGVRYGVLYDMTLIELLEVILKKLDAIPSGLANASVRKVAQAQITQFIHKLNTTISLTVDFQKLTLRDLYERYPRGVDSTVDQVVRDSFEALDQVAGMRLCLPFQDLATPVSTHDMNLHIQDLAHCDLQDLYELSVRRYPQVAHAARRDRGNGILMKVQPRPVEPEPTDPKQEGRPLAGGGGGGGGNNYRRCNNNVCEDVTTSSFCSTGADGSCSVSTG